jgi:RimJ/RimL family protein N-acetyltransferase
MTRRQAHPFEFDEIYEIFMEPSVNRFMSFEIMSKEDFRTIFAELTTPPSTLMVFEEGGCLAGVCAVVRKQRRQAHVAYIGSLALKPKYQGKGLGLKCMQELIHDLKREGFKRIELIVEADNPRAIKFYERLGFQQEGRMRNFLKRKDEEHFVDDIYMAMIVQ